MMRQVSHKHIVYLYGVCVRDVESKFLLSSRGQLPAGVGGFCEALGFLDLCLQ